MFYFDQPSGISGGTEKPPGSFLGNQAAGRFHRAKW
jgi:hypothetical protein